MFTDTNARIANYIPQPGVPQSVLSGFDYVTDADETELVHFSPFVITDTLECLVKGLRTPSSPSQGLTAYVKTPLYVLNACKYGRPLWGALISTFGRERADRFADIFDCLLSECSTKWSLRPAATRRTTAINDLRAMETDAVAVIAQGQPLNLLGDSAHILQLGQNS